MALEQKLNLRMSQRLIMTPSLQQAIKMLQMTKLELQQEGTQELTENPLLEELQETPESTSEDEKAEGEESAPSEASEAADPEPQGADERETDSFDEIDYEAYFQDYMDLSFTPRAPSEEVETRLEGIRQQRGEKDLEVAKWYERTRQPAAAEFYYRLILEDWPQTLAADEARARLRAMGVELQQQESEG